MRKCPKCGKEFQRHLGTHVLKCGVTYEQTFWSFVTKGEESTCWPFTGAKHRDGYGRFNGLRPDGKRGIRIAHRAAWEFAYGAIPEGQDVCHSCDNPICCNPAHLWLGTAFENMQDASRKGRVWRGGGRSKEQMRKLLCESSRLEDK